MIAMQSVVPQTSQVPRQKGSAFNYVGSYGLSFSCNISNRYILHIPPQSRYLSTQINRLCSLLHIIYKCDYPNRFKTYRYASF